MLKFNQKIGESIHIDDEIQITVFEIDRDKVTLGLEAPRHVRIYRTELYPQTGEKKSNAPK